MAKPLLRWQDEAGNDRLVFVDLVTELELTDDSEITEHALEDGALAHDHQIQSPLVVTCDVLQSNTPNSTEETGFDYASVNLAFLAPETIEKTYRLEVRPVQTTVLSPFLFAGRAVSAALDAGVGALGGALGVTIPDGKTITLRKGQKGTAQNVKITTLQGPGDDRVMALWEEFRDVKRNSRFLTLVTRRYEIGNLLLKRIQVKHQSGERGAGRFALEFQQVNVVSTDVVALPVPKLKPKKSAGKKPPGDATKSGSAAGEDSATNKEELKSLLYQMTNG